MLAGGLYQLSGDLLDPRWHILVREAANNVVAKDQQAWLQVRYERLRWFLSNLRSRSHDAQARALCKQLLEEEAALFGSLRAQLTGVHVEQNQEVMVTQAVGAWEQEFGKRHSRDVEASIDAAAAAFQQLRASVRKQGRV